MAIASYQFDFAIHPRSKATGGIGYFAGDLPPDSSDTAPDGRARVLNVPGRVFITVYERGGMSPIASTLSAPDGTWRISHLNPDSLYLVIGVDRRGQVNSAIQDWVRPFVPEP